MRTLQSALKIDPSCTDRIIAPEKTISIAKARLENLGANFFKGSQRIDSKRLGIPVYMSFLGSRSSELTGSRKQMGKGETIAQAEASALMEVVERLSFFQYFSDSANFEALHWDEAAQKGQVIPTRLMLSSVKNDISEKEAESLLRVFPWRFALARKIGSEEEFFVPADWFYILNNVNGAAAGNCLEESVLHGICEIIERDVCARISFAQPELPTISPENMLNAEVEKILNRFEYCGIKVLLKDFSLDMPLPTVGVLAMDPSTFPEKSEIVFTAGTATSPAKALLRALAEVAQLAGDFETASTYEPSGLPKFANLVETSWLNRGPAVALATLPNLENPDIFLEIRSIADKLEARGISVYSLETTYPSLTGLYASFTFAPGLNFRERAKDASFGVLIGRIITEIVAPRDMKTAWNGLVQLSKVYPNKGFVFFYEAMLHLQEGRPLEALEYFANSEVRMEEPESRSISSFYQAHVLCGLDRHAEAVPHLDRAIILSPEVKEYFNLRGVSHYKTGNFDAAEADFARCLGLDPGSAIDLANIGMCLAKKGRFKEAEHFLSSALFLEPELDFAQEMLGQINASATYSISR